MNFADFALGKVFKDENNLQIFQDVIKQNWECLLQGINLSVFTYGQTSSGKTWTMRGDDKDPGLVVHTLKRIFTELGKDRGCFCKLDVSYFEVYNEKINDLLVKESTDLEIRQKKSKEVFIQGLESKEVMDSNSAIKWFKLGEDNRKYASTDMNHRSSRSHVILQVKIETRYRSQPHKRFHSTLMMADLAGSECIQNTKATGATKREGSSINKSLLSLSKIIIKLSENRGEKKFICFRESKLTRIFQPVLSANSKTLVICTVNPKAKHIQESINTIKFGLTAGGIKIKTKPQKVLSVMTKEDFQEIEDLSSKYEELFEEAGELRLQVRLQKNEISMLKDKADLARKKFDDVCKLNDLMRNENEELIAENKQMISFLENTMEKAIDQKLSQEVEKYNSKIRLLRSKVDWHIEKGERLSKGNFEDCFKEFMFDDPEYVRELFNKYVLTEKIETKFKKKVDGKENLSENSNGAGFFGKGQNNQPKPVFGSKAKLGKSNLDANHFSAQSKRTGDPESQRKNAKLMFMGLSPNKNKSKRGGPMDDVEKDIEICKLKETILKLNNEIRDLRFELETERGILKRKPVRLVKPNSRSPTPTKADLGSKKAIGGLQKESLGEAKKRKMGFKSGQMREEEVPDIAKGGTKRANPSKKSRRNRVEPRTRILQSPSKHDLKKQVKHLKARIRNKESIIDGYDKKFKLLKKKIEGLVNSNKELVEQLDEIRRPERPENRTPAFGGRFERAKRNSASFGVSNEAGKIFKGNQNRDSVFSSVSNMSDFARLDSKMFDLIGQNPFFDKK